MKCGLYSPNQIPLWNKRKRAGWSYARIEIAKAAVRFVVPLNEANWWNPFNYPPNNHSGLSPPEPAEKSQENPRRGKSVRRGGADQLDGRGGCGWPPSARWRLSWVDNLVERVIKDTRWSIVRTVQSSPEVARPIGSLLIRTASHAKTTRQWQV